MVEIVVSASNTTGATGDFRFRLATGWASLASSPRGARSRAHAP